MAVVFGMLAIILGHVRLLEAASLTLQWDHSTDSNVAGYVISYGTQSGNYPAKLDVGYVTSAILTGLVNGTTYYVIMQSYDGSHLLGPSTTEVAGQTPVSP